MRILYGVQGTGNGHTARARVMAKAFANRDDVQVDYLFTGRDKDKYFDMQVFGDFQTRRGLTFITANGAVQKWQTVKSAHLTQFFRDVRNLDLSGYDLVINDFEPVSAWAAKRRGVKCISVSHQAALSYPVPKQGETLFDRMLTRHFAPSDIQIGVHWYHFGHSIIPPFIEEQPEENPQQGHYLVYLPFESLDDIEALLAPLCEYQFECFHPDLPADRDQGNIRWRKTSKPKFKHSLLHCDGVIANGGFELSSECLQLGKKLLIKPLQGQYEQTVNMLTLQQLGLCTPMPKLSRDAVKVWLPATSPEPVRFPDSPMLLVEWLLKREWHKTEELCRNLWQQVRFPASVEQRLNALVAVK